MRKSSSLAAVALLALLAFVGVPDTSCRPPPSSVGDSGDVSCATDVDCANALDAGNCDQGVCVLCQGNSDCSNSAQICVAGTCVASSGSGSTSGGSGSGGGSSSTGGLPPGQCTKSCDCTSPAKPACVSGNCGPRPADGGCVRNNDCPCGEGCLVGQCKPTCTTNSQCQNPTPVCYTQQQFCGPCTQSSQCPSGQSCITGTGAGCQSTPDGGCSAQHCCNDTDCPVSEPQCNPSTGVCGPCTSSSTCNFGYSCVNGACKAAGDGGGCPPAGCPAGQTCQGTTCVPVSCNPPCPAPQICGAGNSCVCPANCGGICPSGQTCDTANCQCGVASGGSSGGFSFGSSSGGLPAFCSSSCTGCPSSQTCMCPNLASGLGETCVTGDIWCYFGGYCQ
ncbi:MAG: hypothetical protein ACYDCL_11765 [Myxococcales bacterium]